MKRIGFVTPNLAGGGAERVVLSLAKGLAARGHDVHLFLLENKIEYPLAQNYSIHPLTESGKASRWFLLKKKFMARLLQQRLKQIASDGTAFDFLVSTVPDADLVAAKITGVPVFYRITNTLSAELASLKRRKGACKTWRRERRYRALYKHKNLIAVSNGMKHDLLEVMAFKPSSVQVIYNPFDFDAIKNAAKSELPEIPTEPYIIHVGRAAEQKRHDLLLDAYSRLHTDIKLVLLTNKSRRLEDLIAKYHLENKVICPGFQQNPYAWVARAKLLVLCSDREGLPGVLIEALACQTPVVSTDCPSGPSEILIGSLATNLVPCGDVDALLNKIEEKLHEPKQEFPTTLLERFSAERVVSQYECLESAGKVFTLATSAS